MDFFRTYFIEPILHNGWFNPFNTIVYGICLILGFVFVLKLLKWLKIPINGKLFSAILPFIFWASTTRALRDFIYYKTLSQFQIYTPFFTDIYYHFSVISFEAYKYIYSIVPFHSFVYIYSWLISLFPTPFSYIITFSLTFASLLISIVIERLLGIKYWKVMIFVGVFLCFLNLIFIPWKTFKPIFYFTSIMAFWLSLFFGLSFLLKRKNIKTIFTYQNSAIINAHMFDATSTFIALSFFGFVEQHPVPRFFIGFTNPFFMFILKLLVLIPILWMIDKEAKDVDYKNLLKIGITILGLAPGIRDFVTLLIL